MGGCITLAFAARHAARATALGLIDTTACTTPPTSGRSAPPPRPAPALAAMIDFQVTAGSPMAFGRLTPTW